MLYTIGKTEGYRKYMKDCLEKGIKPEKGKGGTVWLNIGDVIAYLREISNGNEYTIYGVKAEWLLDTCLPEWNGEESENDPKKIKYRELLRDAELVELEHEEKTEIKIKEKQIRYRLIIAISILIIVFTITVIRDAHDAFIIAILILIAHEIKRHD